MKMLMARLKNYIGIYNGIGKNDITLQFEDAKHIITIEGPNGSGKSTILNALNPFPDSLDKLIPGIEGGKFLSYIKGQDLYNITIVYPVTNSGNRGTTKAYIIKNGANLNPNGNVTEYKEILSNEFELDSSFLALSQLSSEDKGLADKRPAERKRFVNEMLDEMSSYNTIYKTLTKKANFMKGTINNLNDKIAKVGGQNPQAIKARIGNLDVAILKREDDLLDLNRRIGALELVLTNNEAEYSKYGLLKKKAAELSEQLRQYHPDFTVNTNMDAEIKKLTTVLYEMINDRSALDTKIKYDNQMVAQINKDIEEADAVVIKARNELMVMTGIDDIKSIDSFTNEFESQKLRREELINNIKELDFNNQKITINALDSYLIYANTLSESLMNYGELATAVYEDYKTAISVATTSLKFAIERKAKEEDRLKNLSRPAIDISDPTTALESYPADCVGRADCPYVKMYDNRLSLKEAYESHHNMVKKYEASIKTQEDAIAGIQNHIAICKLGIKIDELLESVANNFNIKMVIANYSPAGCITALINKLEQIRPEINLVEELRALNASYTASLEAYYKISSKAEKINQCNAIINDNTARVEELSENLASINSELDLITQNYDEIKEAIEKQTKKISDANTFVKIREEYFNCVTEIDKFNDLIKAKNQTSAELDKLRRQQYNDNNVLKELKSERDLANHTYMMLQEYLEEYDRYTKEYSKIETIKKFASPTTGIQTFFMMIYMNKILVTANKLLALMFGGNFVLQPFVINETEFRIPCAGSGYLNDDITSMSLSQRSMIGMIINFAMMFSSSNAYNIIKLDEIDSGLDTENRLQFINVLNQVMQIMHCEQCFMVSHNLELDESLITKIHTTKL